MILKRLPARLITGIATVALAVPALAQQTTQQQPDQQDLYMQIERLEQQVFMLQQQLNELETTLGRSIVGLERQQSFDRYRRNLDTLRPRIEAADDPEATAQELAQIRENIGFHFARTGTEGQQQWAQLQEQFGTLQEQVRQGDAAAVETLDEILAVYDQVVRLTMRPQRELLTFERQEYQDFWTQLDFTDRAHVLQEAERFLRTLGHDIETGWATDYTVEQLGWIRTAIASAYLDPEVGEVEEPGDALTGRGQELYAQLEQLEEQVRQGDPAASQTLEQALENLQEAVREEGQVETEPETQTP